MTAPATTEIVAGRLQPQCSCCAEHHELMSHVSLGSTRRFCPASGSVYLDRGDGCFHPDGATLAVGGPRPTGEVVPEIVSDRPVRTEQKTRIILENATFA